MATIVVPAHPAGWPPEPIPPVGYLSRKALPIKRNDAEPLTREDVQYDLLYHIFADKHSVFHSPIPGKICTFRDLYIHALYNSNKCSKVLKDKMVDTPAFGVELAKIALLTNVGRINTTMAFFPEMKTALRTYHPVPCLQKTDGNAQDAPRIKNCLKAALLPSEFKSVPPSTPDEILEKTRSGQRPPTSVVNLIFVMSNHAAPLASVHFDGNLNFLDIFLPKALSSQDRARAFLWLMYHYLEGPEGQNPYDDSYSRSNPGKAPLIRKLTKDEEEKENVDTQEEKQWGVLMTNQRNLFLSRLVVAAQNENMKKRAAAPHFVTAPPETRRQRSFVAEIPKEEASFMYYVPNNETPLILPDKNASRRRSNRNSPAPERSMLDQAWHTVTAYDPLLDSDEESQDENVQLEYTRRLGVITRLRGRPPTPEPVFENLTLGRFQQVQSWD
ncbi:Ino eighty subunit 1 [Favolaschia claudopus]|uniref:Ino eighty subunit 1 n=1 Tax=Favolaschia claudopus TaxID=2862362 RepID=A0AAW0EK82_9AGAR